MNDAVVLTTERLALRKMNKDDTANLLEIFADPVAMQYYPSTKNEHETNAWINWTLENYAKFGSGLWIVEDKRTGEFLGQCGLVLQKVDGSMEMEIGYLFKRSIWGNGYATEAALACKEYGFTEMKLRKLISLIDVHNVPSVNVAERVGMKREKNVMKWEKEIAVYTVYR